MLRHQVIDQSNKYKLIFIPIKRIILQLYSFKAKILEVAIGSGQRFAVPLLTKGYKVYGIDIDKKKVSTLSSNESYLERIDNSKVREFNKKNIAILDIVIFIKLAPVFIIILSFRLIIKEDISE